MLQQRTKEARGGSWSWDSKGTAAKVFAFGRKVGPYYFCIQKLKGKDMDFQIHFSVLVTIVYVEVIHSPERGLEKATSFIKVVNFQTDVLLREGCSSLEDLQFFYIFFFEPSVKLDPPVFRRRLFRKDRQMLQAPNLHFSAVTKLWLPAYTVQC